MVIYCIYNKHLKKFYTLDKSNPRGYNWVTEIEKARWWRGESSRSACFTTKHNLLQDQGYWELQVQKFELTPVKDV